MAIAAPCAAQTVQVVLPPPVAARPLPAGVIVQPVNLTRVRVDMASGTPWLQEFEPPYFLMPCAISSGTTQWREQDNTVSNIDSFSRIFRDELKATGFRTGGDPTNLFEDQKSADLQVGGLITSLRVKTCWTAPVGGKVTGGSGAMEIEWQVYSVIQAKILARIKTRGGFELKPAKDGSVTTIVIGAFSDNVRRLVASDEFRGVVIASVTPSTVATPVPEATPIRLAAAQPVLLATAVKSVVTIFAGEGMGSGVLISSDGYILTNHHVAGSTGRVRIRWPDGTDTVGDVIRGDPRRDVALVKTEPKGAPLSIRAAPAQLGETVFAVGTPLDKQFANTLTRGIVSATRLIDGLSVIQSDVAIDHGSSGGPLLDEKGQIVALTVSRVEPDGVGHDINFFIPIADALKALAIQPTGGS